MNASCVLEKKLIQDKCPFGGSGAVPVQPTFQVPYTCPVASAISGEETEFIQPGGAVFSAFTPPFVPVMVIPWPHPISKVSNTPSLSSSKSKTSLTPSPSLSVHALIELFKAYETYVDV